MFAQHSRSNTMQYSLHSLLCTQGRNPELLEYAFQWVCDECRNKDVSIGESIDITRGNWNLECVVAPEQANAYDCGMFILAYAQHLVCGTPVHLLHSARKVYHTTPHYRHVGRP